MKRIVVMGMGRSGTTFLTEFLGKCGAVLGQVNWAQEHEFARLINDTLLAKEYKARPGLPYGKLPKNEIQPGDYWHDLAGCFVRFMDAEAKRAASAEYWAFKDPRTTVLHNIWLGHFDVVIGMFRSPYEVEASYLGQGWVKGWNPRQTVKNYWKRFNQSLLHVQQACKGKKPVYILNYNADIAAQTRRLCDALGLPLPAQAQALFKGSEYHYRVKKMTIEPNLAPTYEALVASEILRQ